MRNILFSTLLRRICIDAIRGQNQTLLYDNQKEVHLRSRKNIHLYKKDMFVFVGESIHKVAILDLYPDHVSSEKRSSRVNVKQKPS